MILGADNQNQNLNKAASKRIDTSPRLKASHNYSAKVTSNQKTSSGGDSTSSWMTDGSSSQESRRPPDQIKGSYEGLSNGSSAHIQMDGSGYDNPSIQSSRYSDRSSKLESYKQNTLSKFSNNGSSNFQKNGIITNYSSGFYGDTIASRMKDYLSTEKYFG